MRLTMLLAMLALASIPMHPAQAQEPPTGRWTTIDDASGKPKSVVEIHLSRDGSFAGRVVEILDPARPEQPARVLGYIDLMFSHINRNMAGVEFPGHNFVFSESFVTLLRMSGVRD